MSEVRVTTQPPDLLQRFRRYPRKLDAAMKATMSAAMLVAHEKVPPYPTQPIGTSYVRTGTLGRSLGVSQAGGKMGTPSIFEGPKRIGEAAYQGTVGTNLRYAPFVIGENQARHMGHWWTVKTWSRAAAGKIQKLFDQTAEQLAAFLDGRG